MLMVCTVLPDRNLMVLLRSLDYAFTFKGNVCFFFNCKSSGCFKKLYKKGWVSHFFPSSLNADKCTFGTVTSMLCSSPCWL